MRGYPNVNTGKSISIISISNAIDYLTKSNKDGLFQGKGGRGASSYGGVTQCHPPPLHFKPVHITGAAHHTCAMSRK